MPPSPPSTEDAPPEASPPNLQMPSTDSDLQTEMEDASFTPTPPPSNKKEYRNMASFWLLGLLNNSSYVIMLACAKSISEGGTGLVFLANVVPGLLIKLSAPYWFDRVGYNIRMGVCTGLMAGSFGIVGWFSRVEGKTGMELFGVALGSAQCSMGEASLLALAGKFDSHSSSSKGQSITYFSSGTGLAGVFGFFFIALLNDWIGLSLPHTLLVAQLLVVSYWHVYWTYLGSVGTVGGARRESSADYLLQTTQHDDTGDEEGGVFMGLGKGGKKRRKGYDGLRTTEDECDNRERSQLEASMESQQRRTESSSSVMSPVEIESAMKLSRDEWDENTNENLPAISHGETSEDERSKEDPIDVSTLSTMGRLKLVLSFYPYMIPLFVVYAAEYALQAGAWTAIGFPVDKEEARDQFYEYSNWMYQAGVFISRSSGTVYAAPLSVLWLMPFLQCVNVVFFYYVASYHFWYNYALLIPCFYVGLLGGAVYVNGYTRICADLPVKIREFALSSTSVAESFGVMVADVTGLFLQSCLYDVNNISGAVVRCPF